MGGCVYQTKQGDMWDYIAWTVYGDESYVSVLYRANPQFLDTYIFEAGIEIVCPEITVGDDDDENNPEWRDEEGLEEALTEDSGEEEE